MIVVFIVVLLLLIEVVWKPRLDITSENQVILWYGRKVRNYEILF